MGTDPKILKWKPPHENTIDFKLISVSHQTSNAILVATAQPVCHAVLRAASISGDSGSEDYEFFDELWVEPEEWRLMVESGEQFDDRVVECVWTVDPQASDRAVPLTRLVFAAKMENDAHSRR